MSAVGLHPAPVNEIEEISKAYGSLNDVSRNIADADRGVKNQDQECLSPKSGRVALGSSEAKIIAVGRAEALSEEV